MKSSSEETDVIFLNIPLLHLYAVLAHLECHCYYATTIAPLAEPGHTMLSINNDVLCYQT